MSDELPSLWALDMAAKAAGRTDWVTAERLIVSTTEHRSFFAHARTLAKYEKPPVDEAELKRRQDAREAAGMSNRLHAEKYRTGDFDEGFTVQAAYIALCHRDGVTPTPVSEWSDK